MGLSSFKVNKYDIMALYMRVYKNNNEIVQDCIGLATFAALKSSATNSNLD